MQGILSAVEGLTAVVAPLLAAGLFYAFTTHLLPVTFPGAPFAFAALAAGFGLRAAVQMATGGYRVSRVRPIEAPEQVHTVMVGDHVEDRSRGRHLGL